MSAGDAIANDMHRQCLVGLDDLGRAHVEFCAKDPIPEAACYTEAVLVVSEMVLEMVLLELLVVRREPCAC